MSNAMQSLKFRINAIAALALVLTSSLAMAVELPSSEGMTARKVRGFDQFWLKSGVDFANYDRVRVQSPAVQWSESWLSRYNREHLAMKGRLTEADLIGVRDDLQAEFDQAFPQALVSSGLQIGTEPSRSQLLIEAELIKVRIRYPDLPAPSRTEVLVENAGEATLLLRFRDGQSGELLGWALDRRETRDYQQFRRATQAFNRVEFHDLFQRWGRSLGKQLRD